MISLEDHIAIARSELSHHAATLDARGGQLSPSYVLGHLSHTIEAYIKGAYDLGKFGVDEQPVPADIPAVETPYVGLKKYTDPYWRIDDFDREAEVILQEHREQIAGGWRR